MIPTVKSKELKINQTVNDSVGNQFLENNSVSEPNRG